MLIKIPYKTFEIEPKPFTINCPGCGSFATFNYLQAYGNNGEFPVNDVQVEMKYLDENNIELGHRICPMKECRTHVFFIRYRKTGEIYTYPQQRINFDMNSIPSNILSAFNEAITCHSNNCFVASAIMIRKTLEELCADRGATGSNLKLRLQDLGTKIVIPKELIEGMDELRLLGNDAAHIESQNFNGIGKEEVEISIEFTKEILKSVYQYDGLLTKLRGLKTT